MLYWRDTGAHFLISVNGTKRKQSVEIQQIRLWFQYQYYVKALFDLESSETINPRDIVWLYNILVISNADQVFLTALDSVRDTTQNFAVGTILFLPSEQSLHPTQGETALHSWSGAGILCRLV